MILRGSPIVRTALVAVAVAGMLTLAACAPDDPGPSPSASRPSPVETQAPDDTASPSPTPSATPVAIPTDCRAILSESVLAELGTTPLNDPAFAPTGVLSDGSLVCVWRDPGADVTGLTTEISRMNRGPALDMLNALAADEGFSCYTPSGGTRCEKAETTPDDAQYPGIVQGRTLFWRDGILIDTRYANLAPSGYTGSIIDRVFG